PRGIPRRLVPVREALSRTARSLAQLLRSERVAAAFGVAEERVDLPRGSARVVPVVLPLLLRAPVPRRRAADQALARSAPARRADREELPPRGPVVPSPAAPGAAPLGV